MKDLKKHTIYYLSLVLILGLGALFFFQASYDRQLQLYILLIMFLFYFVFGMAHHFANHDLSIKIVVEYLLMGGIGVSLVLLLMKGVT